MKYEIGEERLTTLSSSYLAGPLPQTSYFLFPAFVNIGPAELLLLQLNVSL